MVPTCPTPDAVLIPDRYKVGYTLVDRVRAVADIAEPILGLKRDDGQRAVLRKQDRLSLPLAIQQADCSNMTLATPRNTDLLYFPPGHPLAGQGRYAWVRKPNGIWWGWLVPEAKSEEIQIVEHTDRVHTPIH